MHYYFDVLKKYAEFSGRATRKEYWMYVLFAMIIGQVVSIILGNLIGSTTMALIWAVAFNLATFLPSLAVGVRRLHDTDHSGWWTLIGLIPIVGIVVLLVFLVSDSQAGSNQYGSNPKESVVV